MNNIQLNTMGTLYYITITTLLITSTLANQLYNNNTSSRCKADEFMCIDSPWIECIAKSQVCDTVMHCGNGIDEDYAMCQAHVCDSSLEHKCKSGQCVGKYRKPYYKSPNNPNTILCDGRQDCNDGSDENATLCELDIYYASIVAVASPAEKDSYPVTRATPSALEQSNGHASFGIRATATTKRLNSPTTAAPPKPAKMSSYPVNTTQQRAIKCTVPANNKGSRYYYKNVDGDDVPLIAGAEVDKFNVVHETCEEGYYKVVPYKFMLCDYAGNWYPRISDKLCLKKCPPVRSAASLNVTCTFNCENVDCLKPAVPGTRLKPKCNYLHSFPNGLKEPEIELHCLPNGQWDGQLYECVPNCGRSLQYRSQHGDSTANTAETIPWNVAIYKQNTNSTFELTCGGTLIASNLVISGGRCFWEKGLTNNTLKNNGRYKITVGNKRELVLKNNSTQFINIDSIFIERDYFGQPGNFVNDIAIVVLSNSIQNYDSGASPACIDWSAHHNGIQNGFAGRTAGWRITKNIDQSTEILNVTLPYIDSKTCRELYTNTNGFDRYITKDKFCAGSIGVKAIYEVDSGAGLTFDHNGLHFLTGVKSVQELDTTSSLSTFSDIRVHIEFIRNIYTRYTGAVPQ